MLQIMREMHAMMGGNRPLLLQYTTETVDAMDGEADVVITKAAEVIFTKDDEQNTQVYPEEKSLKNTVQVTSRIDQLSLTKTKTKSSSSSSSVPTTKWTNEYRPSCMVSAPCVISDRFTNYETWFTTQSIRVVSIAQNS
jgi:hypothetical protein